MSTASRQFQEMVSEAFFSLQHSDECEKPVFTDVVAVQYGFRCPKCHAKLVPGIKDVAGRHLYIHEGSA